MSCGQRKLKVEMVASDPFSAQYLFVHTKTSGVLRAEAERRSEAMIAETRSQ